MPRGMLRNTKEARKPKKAKVKTERMVAAPLGHKVESAVSTHKPAEMKPTHH